MVLVCKFFWDAHRKFLCKDVWGELLYLDLSRRYCCRSCGHVQPHRLPFHNTYYFLAFSTCASYPGTVWVLLPVFFVISHEVNYSSIGKPSFAELGMRRRPWAGRRSAWPSAGTCRRSLASRSSCGRVQTYVVKHIPYTTTM